MSLDFYAAQSVFSDPGELARLYADLPQDAARLARIARDLVVHRVEGEPGTPLSAAAVALYDRAALVAGDDVPFDAARRLFAEDDTLRTPRTVLCSAPFNGPSRVTLR